MVAYSLSLSITPFNFHIPATSTIIFLNQSPATTFSSSSPSFPQIAISPFSYVIAKPPPAAMRFTLRMDISTSGAHEGLFISTGLFTSDSSPAHPLVWPAWPPTTVNKYVPSTSSGTAAAPILRIPSPAAPFQNAITLGDDMEKMPQQGTKRQSTEDIFRPEKSGDEFNDTSYALKVPWDQKEEGEFGRNMTANTRIDPHYPSASSKNIEIPSDETIKLNVFCSSDDNPQELVPLMGTNKWRPIGTSAQNSTMTESEPNNNLYDAQGDNNEWPIPMNPGPLLCDTSTITTTTEVFRARTDSDNFLQIPKSPLGPRKESVGIIPVRGPEYERMMDRSETRFSGHLNPARRASPTGRSVQWGETVPIPPSPTCSSSSPVPDSIINSSPSPVPFVTRDLSPPPPSIGPFSPPQCASTPSFSPFPSDHPIGDQHPPLMISPPADVTILRRQQQQKSERHLMAENGNGEAERPPRPQRRRNIRTPEGIMARQLSDREVPPRPPKPQHLLIRSRPIGERSQSVGAVHRIGLEDDGRPMRGASSTHELYKTRDCLGRLICEW